MTDIASLYKKEDGRVLIEIKISSVNQLFNSFDPAPFYEKELDHDAEQYIVDTVNDFPLNTRFKIVIHMPPELAGSANGQQIGTAVRNHFEYRMLVADRKLRARFRYGRSALIIGLTFLFIALIARQVVSTFNNHILSVLFADALLVTGWAAMWEPVTVLLYELWPIHQRKKTFQKIRDMEIDVRPTP
jgi:hypothetical protein